MEEANKSITETLKNGQYFIDARNWYLFKYVNPFVERNIIIVLISFFLVAIAISFLYYQTMIEVNPQVQYISNTDDITQTYSIITPLGDKDDNPQEMLELYMAKLFLEKRENYNYAQIDDQTNFIRNSASNEVFKGFQDYMSINNPDSPALLLQNNSTRTITITSIKPDNKEKNSYLIYFEANIFSPKDRSSEKTKWLAKISYEISSIYKLIEEDSKVLDFKVTNYMVQKLN